MEIVEITIKERVASASAGIVLVCNNPTDTLRFVFDAEWDSHTERVARFEWDGSFVDVPFTGNEVNVPEITNTLYVNVGVYSDGITSTPVKLQCKRSVLCLGGKERIPADNVNFNQFIGCLGNKANALTASASGSSVVIWPDAGSTIEVNTDGTKIVQSGKNICQGFENGVAYNNTAGADLFSTAYGRTPKIPVIDGVTYVQSNSQNLNVNSVHFWDADGNWLGRLSTSDVNARLEDVDAAYMAFVYYRSAGVNLNWVQVEVGTAATAYEEFVYYNEFDVVDGKIKIAAVYGMNTLFGDGSAMEVTYNKSIAKVIEELTDAIISLGGNV